MSDDERIMGGFRFSNDPKVEPEQRARIIAMVTKLKAATEGEVLIEALSALQTTLVHALMSAPNRHDLLAMVLMGIDDCYRGCEQAELERARAKDTN